MRDESADGQQAVMQKVILLVDDDPLYRESLKEDLEERGYRVREATDAEEAVNCLRDSLDLVLVDYGLPDQTGVAVLNAVRSRDARIPVILLSAFPTPAKRREAVNAGARLVLDKLDDSAHIIFAVESALGETELPYPGEPG